MKSRKILFYVHFNKNDEVDDYVVYQLQQMRPIFDKVILISNSQVKKEDKKKLDRLCDKFIQRENKGYDFAAWRDGMNQFGWDKLPKYDEMTIMNDTCFGPIHDFAPIYKEMQSRGVDFWGMTSNIALKGLVKSKNGKYIFSPKHIQSYYITFNKNIIMSDVFKGFWTGVKDFEDITDVIINYEIDLTDLLKNAGFTFSTYYNASEDWGIEVVSRKDADISSLSAGDMSKYNPGYTCTRPLWLLTVVDKYPFIKTKAIIMASAQMGDIRQYIINNTSYPVQLIDSYIGSRYSDLVEIKDKQVLDIQNSKSYKLGRMASRVYRKVIK